MKKKAPLSSPEYHEKAIAMADANPAGALVFAVLALANAVDHIGTDMTDLAKGSDKIATELGGVAQAVADVSRELVR